MCSHAGIAVDLFTAPEVSKEFDVAGSKLATSREKLQAWKVLKML